MPSGHGQKTGDLNFGEFRLEPLEFHLLPVSSIRGGQIPYLQGVGVQVVHLPLALLNPIYVVVFSQLVSILTDADDTVGRLWIGRGRLS
jgi:hypothetical protein